MRSTPIAPKVSILMCVYNEERTIVQAVRELLDVTYPCETELVIVDDGSTDLTPLLLSLLDDQRLIVYRHSNNFGKGAALRTAAALATGTHILPFDADLEYSPEDIPRMLLPVIRGRSDVVYGARLFGCNTVYQSYLYAFGNRMMTLLANVLYGAYLSDLHTCLKLMPANVFRSLTLSEAGFGLDTEITARILRLGFRPFEVPVSYYSRSRAEGKKISWRDGVACLRILLRIRLARRVRSLQLPSGVVDDGHTSPPAQSALTVLPAAQPALSAPPALPAPPALTVLPALVNKIAQVGGEGQASAMAAG